MIEIGIGPITRSMDHDLKKKEEEYKPGRTKSPNGLRKYFILIDFFFD